MSAPAVQSAPRPLLARPVPIGWRSGTVLLIASVAGLAMFTWPLLMAPSATASSHSPTAPLAFVLILPLVVAIVVAELVDGAIDTKALAMLGVLSAIGAALRPLGAGTAGIETIFFLLVLAGRVFGPGFGFALGATTMFASALITAGVGPWLPFQMMAAAWVGAGAGVLPGRSRSSGGKGELTLLAAYGALAAYAYGALLNLSFWPFAIGPQTELSFVAGAPVLENLHRFVLFTIGTSAAGWDTGRALTTAVAVVLTGPAILSALRRVARRARFTPLA
ncbi:MAG: ECF transporter S component [Actinobacteria bacterium]|nr:ECF transporter S component [Actinomycetota bacterium]